MLNVDALIHDLLSIDSISPNDKGCQALLSQRLQALGFEVQALNFGMVNNLWAKLGTHARTLVFLGHTDVVPSGPEQDWTHPPFTPTITAGKLYARGSADMKVAIACFLAAYARFLRTHPLSAFNVAVLITSCEEADTADGIERALQHVMAQHHLQTGDWCLVGEPSSEKNLGDVIKIGRRGSLNGNLIIYGKQGHIAYPHEAINPNHQAASFLYALTQKIWDAGTNDFEPTACQVSMLQSGAGVTNVIPGELNMRFNFRYSPASNATQLQVAVENMLKKEGIRYRLTWNHSAQPFFSPPGKLRAAVQAAITQVVGAPAQASTGGGTSDGRFMAPYGIETIECGFPNKTIHQVNEYILVADIAKLTEIYYQILCGL